MLWKRISVDKYSPKAARHWQSPRRQRKTPIPLERRESTFPLVSGLGSTNSAAGDPALFVGLIATMPKSDFSVSCISGYGSSPSRSGPCTQGTWSTRRSPGSRAGSFHTCQGLRPRRVGRMLAVAHPPVLPSAQLAASAPGITLFRGSMAGLYAPLPTLRRYPRGSLRTARGRCGSLILHRNGLSPLTPCRSPGAPTVMLERFCSRLGRSASFPPVSHLFPAWQRRRSSPR